MKHVKSLIELIFICLFLVMFKSVAGQNIYGFTKNCFINIDIENNDFDTLIEFPYNLQNAINSTVDRYNGVYYCCGELPGQYGYFHAIDLISKQITSYPYLCYRVEYDMINGRVLCEGNDKLYSFDVYSETFSFISNLDSSYGEISGEVQSYLPHSNQFYYSDYIQGNDLELYSYLFDLSRKAYQCSSLVKKVYNQYLIGNDMVTNDYNDDLIGHHNEYVGMTNPCNGEMNIVLTIQDYKSHLGNQMAIFDHTSLTYIVPYISQFNKYRFALIDIYNSSYTFIDQGEIQLRSHQIYEKPQPPIIFRSDTLYVPKGITYDWYVNDSFIISTNDNFYVPQQSGIHKAYVHFRAYDAFSQEIIIQLSGINEIVNLNVEIYPQPTNNKLTIKTNKNFTTTQGEIFNQLGIKLKEFEFEETTTVSLEGFDDGVYYIVLHSINESICKRIIKQ